MELASPVPVPRGYLASVVTYLEMTDRPDLHLHESLLAMKLWEAPDVEKYLQLFRKIGEHWLWSSRLLMPKQQVAEILNHRDNQLMIVNNGADTAGMIELDFRQAGQCEIGFFGLVPELNGRGHGRWLMNQALDLAWRPDVSRVWLHTCTQDSPSALPFYLKSGFRAYKSEVEIIADPRFTGLHPVSSSPHIPIIS